MFEHLVIFDLCEEHRERGEVYDVPLLSCIFFIRSTAGVRRFLNPFFAQESTSLFSTLEKHAMQE